MSRWHGLYPKKHRAPRRLSLILRRTIGGVVVNEHGRTSRGIGFSSGSVDEQMTSCVRDEMGIGGVMEDANEHRDVWVGLELLGDQGSECWKGSRGYDVVAEPIRARPNRRPSARSIAAGSAVRCLPSRGECWLRGKPPVSNSTRRSILVHGRFESNLVACLRVAECYFPASLLRVLLVE